MRARRVALAVVGLLAGGALGVGAFIGLWSAPRPSTGPGLAGLFGLLLGFVALLALVVRSRIGSDLDGEPAPWTEAGAVVEQPPEATPDDVAVSGTSFAEHVASATRAARSSGDFHAGIDEVRPPLRETLAAALVASGRDRDAVERALAEGSWTDDRLAAAVLDGSVSPPERSFVDRLRDWLFPERAVRRRANRAVAAVDEAASAALPGIVGEDAPRTVPVVAPTLDDLQRTADGHLQRAESVGDGGWGRREPRRDGDGTDGPTRQRPTSNEWEDTDRSESPETDSSEVPVTGGNGDEDADWTDVVEGER